jgi:hypothetical protein
VIVIVYHSCLQKVDQSTGTTLNEAEVISSNPPSPSYVDMQKKKKKNSSPFLNELKRDTKETCNIMHKLLSNLQMPPKFSIVTMSPHTTKKTLKLLYIYNQGVTKFIFIF